MGFIVPYKNYYYTNENAVRSILQQDLNIQSCKVISSLNFY